ncbi:MAG: beta-lactamase family protein [Tatlockia sp.]|nr:beta-lactamase family protein [Tatlockia sp.]
MAFLSLINFTAHALSNSLDRDIQAHLNHFLKTSQKNEPLSGMSLTITWSENPKMIKKNFYAGKISHEANSKPMNSQTLFDIGSITKSYTSALILQLEAKGLLNINDPIGNYLPQYPRWKDVPIRKLLNMTSNIPSYSNNPKFIELLESNPLGEFNDQMILTFANPDAPIGNETKFLYNNSNYVLSGLIIEAVTKQNFADALQTRILDPLKLKNTYYAAGNKWKYINEIILPRKAHGYLYDADKKERLDFSNTNLSWAGASGAMVSTVDDQAQWVEALLTGKIFPEAGRNKALKELMTIVSIKSGQPLTSVVKNEPLGFGLGVLSYYDNNQQFWIYMGSSTTFRMFYLWKACNNLTVLIAMNGKNSDLQKNVQGEENTKKFLLNIYRMVIHSNPQLKCK